jgi:hypothetical protein
MFGSWLHDSMTKIFAHPLFQQWQVAVWRSSGLTPRGRPTPARDGRHFISSAASEAAQSSRTLHSDKQPRATFSPTIVCPSGRRQQKGGERRFFKESSIREPVARSRVSGSCEAAMRCNRTRRAVYKTIPERQRESMGVGRHQMVSCHHRGTAVNVGLGIECLRGSAVQN